MYIDIIFKVNLHFSVDHRLYKTDTSDKPSSLSYLMMVFHPPPDRIHGKVHSRHCNKTAIDRIQEIFISFMQTQLKLLSPI